MTKTMLACVWNMSNGAIRGASLPTDLARRESARKRFSLPSDRLVGELSHPIELFLHLVFSALKPTGANIPHYFSECNAPCSTASQLKIQCVIFSFPHLNLPTPKSYSTITYFQMICFFLYLHSPHCLRRDAGPIHRGRERQQWQVAAAQQCTVGNVVY